MVDPTDHYATLGVSPGADARAIKLAYVARIREHPPETHAEEFQRIRQAYEALSDPEARAAYDASRRAGAPQDLEGEALWSAARAAQQADDGVSARRLLERLVVLQPGAIGAWHALGSVCLEWGAPERAEQAFRKVLEAHPESYGIHLDLARAQHAQGRTRWAMEAADRALRLAGDDRGARVAVADVLLWLGDPAGARRVFEDVQASEASPYPILPLVLRLSRCDLALKKPRQALAGLRVAVDGWRGAGDADRVAAAAALAAHASDFYESGRRREGDLLLAACRALAPSVVPEPPVVALVRQQELGPADLDWLKSQAAPGAAPAGQLGASMGLVGSILLATAALGFLALCAVGVLSSLHPWGPVEATFCFLLLLLLGGLGARGVLAGVRSRRGQLGDGMLLDRGHLVQVGRDRARILPLLLLRAVTVQPQSGGACRVRFGFLGYRLGATARFANRAGAESFAQAVSTGRKELLRLLASGHLQEDPRAAAFPRERLEPGLAPARRLGLILSRGVLLGAGAAVACAALVMMVGARRGAQAEADEQWRVVLLRDRLEEILQVADRPGHPHAPEAAARLAATLGVGRQRWLAGAAAGPGADLVGRQLDPAVQRVPRIFVRVHREVDGARLVSGLLDPGVALASAPEAMLAEALNRALRDAVAGVTGRPDLPSVSDRPAVGALALVLDFRLVVAPGAYRYPPGDRSRGLAVLRAEWSLAARAPDDKAWTTLAQGASEPVDGLPLPLSAWSSGDALAATVGYLAQQRALFLPVIAEVVSAMGAPVDKERIEGTVGGLGGRVPPPGLVRRAPEGGAHVR